MLDTRMERTKPQALTNELAKDSKTDAELNVLD
jgi:hypothetical protein